MKRGSELDLGDVVVFPGERHHYRIYGIDAKRPFLGAISGRTLWVEAVSPDAYKLIVTVEDEAEYATE